MYVCIYEMMEISTHTYIYCAYLIHTIIHACIHTYTCYEYTMHVAKIRMGESNHCSAAATATGADWLAFHSLLQISDHVIGQTSRLFHGGPTKNTSCSVTKFEVHAYYIHSLIHSYIHRQTAYIQHPSIHLSIHIYSGFGYHKLENSTLKSDVVIHAEVFTKDCEEFKVICEENRPLSNAEYIHTYIHT